MTCGAQSGDCRSLDNGVTFVSLWPAQRSSSSGAGHGSTQRLQLTPLGPGRQSGMCARTARARRPCKRRLWPQGLLAISRPDGGTRDAHFRCSRTVCTSSTTGTTFPYKCQRPQSLSSIHVKAAELPSRH